METFAAILIVVGALVFLAHGIYRAFSGKARTCGCGVQACPMQKNCEHNMQPCDMPEKRKPQDKSV